MAAMLAQCSFSTCGSAGRPVRCKRDEDGLFISRAWGKGGRRTMIDLLGHALVSRISGVGPGLLTTQALTAVRPLVAFLVVMIVLLSAGSAQARLATLAVLLPITAASMVATDISFAYGMSRGLPAPFCAIGTSSWAR